MKKRKTIRYVLISAVAVGLLAMPVLSLALENLGTTPKEQAGISVWEIIKYPLALLAWITYGLLFLVAKLLYLCALVFDGIIGITVLRSYEMNNIAAINVGWRIIRDICNIFLVFALLYIAVGVILQLETFNAKKLIAPLILIAVLINFSLVITKMIIDFSNILALQFYNAVDGTVRGPGGGVLEEQSGFTSLSAVFVGATHAQGVYKPSPPDIGEVSDEAKAYGDIAKANFFGSIIFAVAAFVLLAGAVLFIIRYISLIILMVLSPLAFVFGIFPATKKHGQRWWNTLFSQAFFAPAFLFMFYLVAKIAQESSFLDLMGSPTASLGEIFTTREVNIGSGAGTGPAKPVEGGYLINFLILVALMIGSLWVAKEMGARGASGAYSLGRRLARATPGYIGKGAVLGGRLARRAGARAAEGIVTKEKPEKGKWEKFKWGIAAGLRKVPGVARGAISISQRNRALFEKEKEKARKLTPKAIKRSLTTAMMPRKRAAHIDVLAERDKDLKIESGLTEQGIQNALKSMKNLGVKTSNIENVRPDLVEEKTAPETRAKQERIIKRWSKDDVYEISRNTPALFANDDIRKIMYNTLGKDQWQAIDQAGGDAAKHFFENLTELGETVDEVSDKIRKAGNHSAANFLDTTEGADLINRNRPEDAPLPTKFKPHLATRDQMKGITKYIQPKDWKDIDVSKLEEETKENALIRREFIEQMIKNASPEHIQKFIDRGDKLSSAIIERVKRHAKALEEDAKVLAKGESETAEGFAKSLESLGGKPGTAEWAKSFLGRGLLGYKEETEEKPAEQAPAAEEGPGITPGTEEEYRRTTREAKREEKERRREERRG